jgi:hypothetical protein
MARGDIAEPLTLANALTLDRIKPGHTVYLRGGVYNAQSSLTCTLQGTADAPITVRNYPGEVAQIDAALVLSCPHTRWISDDYGLEVIGTSENRYSDVDHTPPPGGHQGITFSPTVTGVELINVRIYDVNGQGIYWFGACAGLVYGCHIFNVGYEAPDRAYDPGIYTHNDTGVLKRIENTFIANTLWRYALQIYSSSTNKVLNYQLKDVVIANSWVIVSGGSGSEYPALDNIVIERLYQTYVYPRLGFYQGARGGSLRMADCVVDATEAAFYARWIDNLTIENCRFSSEAYTLDECETDLSTCRFGNLSGVDANLVPNIYAPRFATLTVFDWDRRGTVNIDVSAFAESGTLRIHNAMLMRSEYRDVEVVAGVLALDMTGWTTPKPLGFTDEVVNPLYTDRFGTWILEKLEDTDAALAAGGTHGPATGTT